MIPDRWWIVELTTDTPWEAEMVPSVLLEAGARAVIEEGEGQFSAPFPPPEDPESALAELRECITTEAGLGHFELSWRWQPHEDWEELWRRGIVARQVTDRVVVAPSWDPREPSPGQIVLTLDPGMAFGTAEHPTTRGCLRLVDGVIQGGERLLDVGSGSGILAVAAALMGAAEVLGLESDPWAVEAARENVVRNAVADRVRMEVALVDLPLLATLGPVDGVLANIERGIVVPLLPGFHRALLPGGWLILSGILRVEADSVIEAATAAGFGLIRTDPEEDWWSALFRRESAEG
jgi:ribosomal protein L11 methyltransferase